MNILYMKELINFIKEYFYILQEELKELLSNILNGLKTKRWTTILLISFILGCFIWKPLFPLICVSFILLMVTTLIIFIILTCSLFGFILFNLHFYDGELAKYPILQLTLGIICAILIFCISTSIIWDTVIKDLWLHPEMWNEILTL